MSEHPRPDRSAPPNMSSYEQTRAAYAPVVPERFNPVVDIVERWGLEAPDDLALVSLGPAGETVAEHTAAQLAELARRAGRALLALGVEPGDRIFVMLPRVPAWYAAMLGAIRIGAVPMPGTNQLTARDIGYRIEAGGAVAAITSAEGAAKLGAADRDMPTLRHRIAWEPGAAATAAGWHDFDALIDAAGDGDGASPLPGSPTAKDDPLLLFFTSGTVSYPKMVIHSQGYGLGHVSTARFWHDLRPGDRHWTVTDTGWAKAAWGGLFGQFHERATNVQVALGKPDADTILRLLKDARITSFCAPPTLYRLLVQADLSAYDLSGLRHCTSAGEPLNPEVIRAWREGTGGLTVYDGYGQSETTVLVANYRTMDVRPGSMGKPVPGWTVDVLDESGAPAPDDTVGAIAVKLGATPQERPVGLFTEYVDDPDANRGAFRDGWYYTGDKAWRDGDGYLWFEGRDDDVITSSAYRIGPFEVESALIEHPAVMEAAVVGKDDPERTQIVCAFVVLAAGYEAGDELSAELKRHAKELTAPYKYPREIHFVTELPKTVSGKIRRSELRGWLRDGAPAGA
ncbi:acyl-CoA synthetase [Conexibacter sp. CPCC 206217]|uniref:acyl-CoA synthetase n=1 Tax=Conexibacter sp. CPCC 206217 TaxID=3064574 RepID=UPI00271A05E3|nr:AMP-binding protein [Conexibacter sp. CPCC 206217]MDO8212435.1 AMP-binding protein [Conexibacter sp. CPCC 206217]